MTDKAVAAGIAATLEGASRVAQAGMMTREKALQAVNDILRLAGLEELAPVPSLADCAAGMLRDVDVSAGTLRKYSGQWEGLKSFLGKRVDLPVSAITTEDMQGYYNHARKEFSVTTAGDHLNFASMVFGRAVDLGHRANNPCAAVARAVPDAVEKLPISRAEHAAVLRAIRREGRRDWLALASLGWHTGHRIQDLLDITPDVLDGDLVTIQPRKKGRRGGRTVVLPVPGWLAAMVKRLGGFKSIHRADNRNGKVSEDFIGWLRVAGVDPMPKARGVRVVNLKSFHSYRHAMTSRLVAAGVSGELSRLVTDHDDPKMQRRYTHAEVQSLREVLERARRR